MKLKYYLRGIGIGVILTAIVMGFALGGRKATISDAEVIERAKQLGMVENSVLSQSADKEGNNNEAENASASYSSLDEAGEETSEEIDQELASASESVSEMAEEEEAGKEASDPAEPIAEAVSSASSSEKETLNDSSNGSLAKADAEDTTESETAAASDTNEQQDAASNGVGKTVTIPGGVSSDAVAQILYNAGVVDNAYSFNRYLIDKGVDRIIRSGTKTIPAGATYEEIARIITK